MFNQNFYSAKMTEEMKAKMRRDIEKSMTDLFVVRNSEVIGQSASFSLACLRDYGWKNLGRLGEFEELCRELGFGVDKGKSTRRGYLATVIYAK